MESCRNLALRAVLAAVVAALSRVIGDGGITPLDFVLRLLVLIIVYPDTGGPQERLDRLSQSPFD